MPEHYCMIQNLIYFHAGLGGIALLTGLIALLTVKGSRPHGTAGKIFFWTMLSSAAISLVVACLPDHESPFLFAIGIFSIYLISTGYLALRYKKKTVAFNFDKVLSTLMIITGAGMIVVPLLLRSEINIVLTVFGLFGILLSIQDFMGFRNPEKLRKNYLQAHIGKMVGGYIAAVTAFVVVNQFLPPLIGWLGPTAILVPLIIFWSRKVSKPS